MISSLACFTFCPWSRNWICSTHPCKTQDNLWPELSSPAFAVQSNPNPIHLGHSLKSLPSHLSEHANMMITTIDRPAWREVEWFHQRWVTWLPSCSLYLLRKTLVHWYREEKEGGMTHEGLVDGVKVLPPGLSALSGYLAWPGNLGLSTDKAFFPTGPVASATNKATIWSPWISKSVSFWFPCYLACFSTLFWIG